MSYHITEEGKEYIEKEVKEFKEKQPEEYKKFTKVVDKLIKEHYLEKKSLKEKISNFLKKKK
ncbi:MAG: hypothetical protein ACKKMV_02845 [Candidatus Nealsonbacteria bacterium]